MGWQHSNTAQKAARAARHMLPPPRSFADFEYEPETPEEVAAEWAGKPDDFADAFFGTDEIDRVTEALFTVHIGSG